MVTGVVALALPATTVRTVAVVVGIGLVLGGALRVAAGFRRGADERYASIVEGLAGVIPGILSLSWPRRLHPRRRPAGGPPRHRLRRRPDRPPARPARRGGRGPRCPPSLLRRFARAAASGLVVAPAGATGPFPVVAWAHGTTGVARRRAPSALADPWSAGAFSALGPGAEGPPHPHLVGVPAARSTLDAVRAARQLDGSS